MNAKCLYTLVGYKVNYDISKWVQEHAIFIIYILYRRFIDYQLCIQYQSKTDCNFLVFNYFFHMND